MSGYQIEGKLRQGRKVGRTLYIQRGDEPRDDDQFIGAVDTADLAAFLCEAHNAYVPVMRDLVAMPHADAIPDAWRPWNREPPLSLIEVSGWLSDRIPHNSVGAPAATDADR